jgi:hypothetical protein
MEWRQDTFKAKTVLAQLTAEACSPDTWLLFLAVLNWLYMLSLYRGPYCGGGVADPWYCSWTWCSAPNRLLIAALCLRARKAGIVISKRGFAIIGFLLSSQVLAAHLFFFFNPDVMNRIWLWEGDGARILQHIRTMLEHELTQGCLAALLVSYALYRFLRNPSRSRLYLALKYTATMGLIILLSGYASNFISRGSAEKRTAHRLSEDSQL